MLEVERGASSCTLLEPKASRGYPGLFGATISADEAVGIPKVFHKCRCAPFNESQFPFQFGFSPPSQNRLRARVGTRSACLGFRRTTDLVRLFSKDLFQSFLPYMRRGIAVSSAESSESDCGDAESAAGSM
jgi:hypothetical protein